MKGKPFLTYPFTARNRVIFSGSHTDHTADPEALNGRVQERANPAGDPEPGRTANQGHIQKKNHTVKKNTPRQESKDFVSFELPGIFCTHD